MELYEQISKIRKQREISQEELAEKVGVSRQAVSKWENGAATPMKSAAETSDSKQRRFSSKLPALRKSERRAFSDSAITSSGRFTRALSTENSSVLKAGSYSESSGLR